MLYKIKRKQNNSAMCLVCGLKNNFGLKARFFETESGILIGEFAAKDFHQSYLNRMHGGAIAAILDETAGRAINIAEPNAWGVTTELNLTYRRPTPYGEILYCIGELADNGSRMFVGTSKIVDANGVVYAEAMGKFAKLPIEKIVGFSLDHTQWFLENENIRTQIEISNWQC